MPRKPLTRCARLHALGRGAGTSRPCTPDDRGRLAPLPAGGGAGGRGGWLRAKRTAIDEYAALRLSSPGTFAVGSVDIGASRGLLAGVCAAVSSIAVHFACVYLPDNKVSTP